MGTSSRTIAIIAALTSVCPLFAAAQSGEGTATGTMTTAATPATVASSSTTTAMAATGQTGGFQINMGVRTRLSYDDNFELVPNSTGGTWIWDTTLNFDVRSVTQTDDLQIYGSGVLRYADIPGRTIRGFEDPRIGLRYTRSAANSQLTFAASFRRADREFLDPFEVEQEQQQSTGLVGDGGTQTTRFASLGYRGGINDPIGYAFTLSHNARDYSGTTDLRLYDNTTDRAQGSVFLRPDQLTQWSLNYGVTKYDAANANSLERTTQDVSVGLQRQIDPTLLFDGTLGYTRIESDEIIGGIPTRSTDSGATASLALTKTLGNGTAGATLSRQVTSNGSYTALRFSRSLTLPLGGLSASLGAVHTESGRTSLIGSLAYTRQLQSSDFSITLDRNVTSNSLDEDVLDTRLTLNYGYTINNLSRLDVTLLYGRSEGAGLSTVPDIDRTTLTASYTRALTPDWNLVGGMQIRQRDETGVGNAHSNSVFLTLGRNFSFRP